jgi:hypothetical protein
MVILVLCGCKLFARNSLQPAVAITPLVHPDKWSTFDPLATLLDTIRPGRSDEVGDVVFGSLAVSITVAISDDVVHCNMEICNYVYTIRLESRGYVTWIARAVSLWHHTRQYRKSLSSGQNTKCALSEGTSPVRAPLNLSRTIPKASQLTHICNCQ